MIPKYRADIDGLRAIAVLAVLFFHAEVPGFSGGFVGVDVFFVISGYLITNIILKEVKEERFSIVRFYERRIRRIFPALFPVILFVLIVSTWLFDAAEFAALGKSVIATTLFSSNILFWQESGYFDAQSLQKPLLHTWSLAVEEQFYIFYPLFLILIHRYLKRKYFFWIFAGFIISFAVSIYGTITHPGATFYLVPARSWELLTGSIIALGVLPGLSVNWQKNLASFSGVLFIFCSILFYSEATPFPGWAALLPVMGSGLVIYAGTGNGTYAAQKVLSAPLLVFTGLISYSLYLWHWPLIAFWKYLMFRPWNGYDSFVISLLSVVLAFLSWKYLEQPFRGANPLLPDRIKLFYASAMTMVTVIATGTILTVSGGLPERIDYFYPKVVTVSDNNKKVWKLYDTWHDTIMQNIKNGKLPPVIGSQDKLPSIVLWGDSHACALVPAIERSASAHHRSCYVLTLFDHPPALGINAVKNTKNKINLDKDNRLLMSFIDKHDNIEVVLLIARWSRYIHDEYRQEDSFQISLSDNNDKNADNAECIEIGLERAVKALLHKNKKVILFTDVPEIGYDVPRVFNMAARVPLLVDIDSVRLSIKEYNDRQKDANRILENISNIPGVSLIRLENRMFDKDGKVRIMSDGSLLYKDDDHLSIAGALYLLPVFDELFEKMDNK